MLRGVVTLAAVLAVVQSSGDLLDYSKQADWGGECNKATSKKQSPVDVISPKTSTDVDGKLLELPEAANKLTASNADDNNAIKFTFAETVKYTIPGLKVEGTVAQLHIHWGAKDSEGSEHLLNGKQYSAETHLVTSYGTDGKYAVVNRFYKAGAENEQVKQMIASAKASGADRKITGFNLTALYPSDIGEVITYEGSLTTPDCTEVVHWVVVPEILTVSTEQLVALRDILLGDGTGSRKLTSNWRSKQALNDRKFTCYKSSSATLLASPLLVVLAIIINMY